MQGIEISPLQPVSFCSDSSVNIYLLYMNMASVKQDYVGFVFKLMDSWEGFALIHYSMFQER